MELALEDPGDLLGAHGVDGVADEELPVLSSAS